MPKDQPNNFPRQGEDTPVTRDYLEQLKANRPIPNESLDYTIGGNAETVVHSSLEAERNYAITRGERILKNSSDDFDHNFTFKSLEGRSKAQFDNAREQQKAAYIKKQQDYSFVDRRQDQALLKEEYIKSQQEAGRAILPPSHQKTIEPSR